MAKKNANRRDQGSTRPKQLRKRLRKAETKLQEARTERDQAQARVEALAVIADEIRAQLSESEGSAAEAKTNVANDAGEGHATEATAQQAGPKKASPPEAPASAATTAQA